MPGKPEQSFKGETDSCPVCGRRNLRLTPTGRLPTHGPNDNRCVASQEMSPLAIRRRRGEGRQQSQIHVTGTSVENRAIFTLGEGFPVVTANGRRLIAAAFVVIVESHKPTRARAVGKLTSDKAPREYDMNPEFERLVLRQLGF